MTPRLRPSQVGRELRRAPIDVAFVGIGENGHLAFNDPPADFETDRPYLVVSLDEACRRQQVGEGWFASVDDVPASAISMSIRQIMTAGEIICVVPDARKAVAVQASIEGEVTPQRARIDPAAPSARHALSRRGVGVAAAARHTRRGARERPGMRHTFPGFFDLQVNGFAGVDFNAPDLQPEQIDHAIGHLRRTGVTRCLPTLITGPLDAFARNARLLARARPTRRSPACTWRGRTSRPTTGRAARTRPIT